MHVVAGTVSGQLSLVSYKENYSVSDYLIYTFPVTGFPNWKYVAILANFLTSVKLSERKNFGSEHLEINDLMPKYGVVGITKWFRFLCS